MTGKEAAFNLLYQSPAPYLQYQRENQMSLSEVIESITQASYDLAQDNHKAHMDERYKAGDFVKTADAQDCLWLINELIDRVSSITGEAGDLEDAACVLIRHIENEGK